jgi:hypothetical protein
MEFLPLTLLVFILLVGTAMCDENWDCDPLEPNYCMLPFPNNFWMGEDGHVALGNTTFPVPTDRRVMDGKPTNPQEGGWNDLEGFSVFPAITTYFPGMDDVSIEDCPRHWDMAVSMDPTTSPTVLIEAETGEVVAHWVEVDHSSEVKQEVNPNPKRAMLIWPATSLKYGTRYIVGIKQTLKNNLGATIKPSPAFFALRSGLSSDDARVDSRRELYENDIFPALEKAGVPRKDLLLAWDFTTNTKDDITRKMLTARDDALERLGERGPRYRVTAVTDDYNDYIYRKIEGDFRMPMYLNTHLPTTDARIVVDEEGNSVFQGYAWFKFEVLIPRSLVQNGITETTGRILQYGHGLFGKLTEVDHDYLETQAEANGWVLCASTWIGLSSQDVPAAVDILITDLTKFMYVPDRTTQGMVNALGLMRMMMGDFAKDEELTVFDGKPTINPELRSYTGNSEGGIFGTVYAAVSTDVTRSVLGVPGGPYGLLLPRSHDFTAEYTAIKRLYPDPVDRINLIQVMQMLWDRAEPSGYMRALRDETLPNTPKHQTLFQYGIADAQVTWLGALACARANSESVMFESNVQTGNETFFGFPFISDDTVVEGGSGIVGFDFGSPYPPSVNVPPNKEYDTHEKVRRDERAQQMMKTFFETGQLVNTCGGPCN